MSKKSKQQYKQFQINSIDDALLVLGSLISPVIHNLNKYREYYSEAQELLTKYLTSPGSSVKSEIIIPAKEYDDINDKLLFRQREILKFLADHQEKSFSYLNLRKDLLNNKYLANELDESITQLLNEFLHIRNWSFHNTQSMLVAINETASKRIPDELKGFVTLQPQINPVIIPKNTGYDIKMLMSLVIHVEKYIERFEQILQSMKNDYSEMYQKRPSRFALIFNHALHTDVVYSEVERISRFDDPQTDMIQLSMGIQKSKYDGSDEAFKRLTLNHK